MGLVTGRRPIGGGGPVIQQSQQVDFVYFRFSYWEKMEGPPQALSDIQAYLTSFNKEVSGPQVLNAIS